MDIKELNQLKENAKKGVLEAIIAYENAVFKASDSDICDELKKDAFEFFNKLAVNNILNSEARLYVKSILANCYNFGVGVKKDENEALKYFEIAENCYNFYYLRSASFISRIYSEYKSAINDNKYSYSVILKDNNNEKYYKNIYEALYNQIEGRDLVLNEEYYSLTKDACFCGGHIYPSKSNEKVFIHANELFISNYSSKTVIENVIFKSNKESLSIYGNFVFKNCEFIGMHINICENSEGVFENCSFSNNFDASNLDSSYSPNDDSIAVSFNEAKSRTIFKNCNFEKNHFGIFIHNKTASVIIDNCAFSDCFRKSVCLEGNVSVVGKHKYEIIFGDYKNCQNYFTFDINSSKNVLSESNSVMFGDNCAKIIGFIDELYTVDEFLKSEWFNEVYKKVHISNYLLYKRDLLPICKISIDGEIQTSKTFEKFINKNIEVKYFDLDFKDSSDLFVNKFLNVDLNKLDNPENAGIKLVLAYLSEYEENSVSSFFKFVDSLKRIFEKPSKEDLMKYQNTFNLLESFIINSWNKKYTKKIKSTLERLCIETLDTSENFTVEDFVIRKYVFYLEDKILSNKNNCLDDLFFSILDDNHKKLNFSFNIIKKYVKGNFKQIITDIENLKDCVINFYDELDIEEENLIDFDLYLKKCQKDTKSKFNLKEKFLLAKNGDEESIDWLCNEKNINNYLDDYVFDSSELLFDVNMIENVIDNIEEADYEKFKENFISPSYSDFKYVFEENDYLKLFFYRRLYKLGTLLVSLGKFLYEGIGCKKNKQKGIKFLIEAAARDDFNLTFCSGIIDNKKDYESIRSKIIEIGKSSINALLSELKNELVEIDKSFETLFKYDICKIESEYLYFFDVEKYQNVEISFRNRKVAFILSTDCTWFEKIKKFIEIFVDLFENHTFEQIEAQIENLIKCKGIKLGCIKSFKNSNKHNGYYNYFALDEEETEEDEAEDNDNNEEIMLFAEKLGESSFYNFIFESKIRLSKFTKIIDVACFRDSVIEEINIPSSVVDIRKSAFRGCSIKSITLPKNLKIIRDRLFLEAQVKSIDIPNSVEIIGEYAFFDSSIEKIKIPNSVRSIGECAFVKKNGEKIDIISKNNNFVLENGIFYDSKKEKILAVTKDFNGKIADSVKSIDNAFIKFDFRAFDKLILPSSLKSLELSFFYYSHFNEIVIPENLKKIIEDDFIDFDIDSEISDIKKISVSPKNKYFKVKNGILTNKIESKIYTAESCIENLILPKNITDCQNLPKLQFVKTIVFPKNVKIINYGAFRSCKNLKKVTLPENLLDIESNAFENCYNLSEINIPKYANISETAFSCCSSLKFNIHPQNKSLKTFGKFITDYAVNKIIWVDRNIESIEIPETITSLDNEDFIRCEKLKYIKISKNIKRISTYAFARCFSIEKIEIDPENENFIVENGILYDSKKTNIYALEKSVKNIFFEKSISDINSFVFAGHLFDKIEVEENHEQFTVKNGILYEKGYSSEENTLLFEKNVKNIVFNQDSVCAYMFYNFENLESIKFDYEIDLIGYRSFENCKNLKTIELTEVASNFSISEFAFENCTSLEKIIVEKDSIAEKEFIKYGLKDKLFYK